MKTLTIISSVIMILFFNSCEKNIIKSGTVPNTIKSAFQSEHQSAKQVEWMKEGENFEVEYKENGLEKSILYDAQGNILETETEIIVSELLPAITDYIRQNYSDYKIEEASKEESQESTFFELEIEGNNQEIEVLFDSNGKFIEQKIEEDDEKDDQED